MRLKKMLNGESDRDFRETVKDDEYDLKELDEAYNEYAKGGYKSRPISELWKELGL